MSTLLQIRQEFVKRYGLYRLVNSPSGAWPDNGANQYIQGGLKYLDMKYGIRHTSAVYKVDVAAGSYAVEFKLCRAIQEVWIDNGDGRSKLTKKTLAWVKENYADPVAELDQDTPLYYCPGLIKLAPELRTLESSDYTSQFTYGYEDILFSDEGDAHEYDAILIVPPPDETFTVEVKGLFYSQMTSDTHTSFWSVNFPNALITAAAMDFEGSNRNHDGAQKLEAHIQRMLSPYKDDVVEEEMTNINQIGG